MCPSSMDNRQQLRSRARKVDLMDDVISAATALIAQYGDDAVVIATLRAAEVAAMGDAEALRHWDSVIDYIENGPPPSDLN